jgi:ribosomal-protein-alanine N-acetyltransferase
VVRLRPLGAADAEQLSAWGRDPEVARHYFGRRHLRGTEGPLLEPGRSASRIVRAFESAEGELLGWVELRNISWRSGLAELRVCIGRRDRWGMGYGTAAVRAMLAEAAARRLRQVHLRVALWNGRAIASYRKCGFRARAVLKAGRRRAEGMEDLLLMTVDLAPGACARAAAP